MKQPTNNIHGEIHVVIDRSDINDELPAVDLIAWFEGPQLGDDTKDPAIWLTVKRTDEPLGSSDYMFCISIARMRAMLAMAEAMHKVGDQAWKETLGEEDDG